MNKTINLIDKTSTQRSLDNKSKNDNTNNKNKNKQVKKSHPIKKKIIKFHFSNPFEYKMY